MNREAFIEAARFCIGTPFHHQGRMAGMGLDCIGLVIHALAAVGVNVQDNTQYGRQPDAQALHDALLAHGFVRCADCYDEQAVQAGDIALFRFHGAAEHVGILSSKDSIIHAFAPARKVVETEMGTTWQTRCLGLYR